MILHHFADLFSDASIVGTLTLMLHMREAITIGTLTKMNAFVGWVVFETPPALFDSCLFVVPPVCKGVRSALSLRSLFLGDFSRDVIDYRRGDVVVGIGYT